MDVDVDQKAVNLTNFLFKTPSYRRTAALLLVASFIFGVIARILEQKTESIVETFLYGGTDGILILAAPALIAALLCTITVSRKQFKQGFKYFALISLAATIFYTAILLFGLSIGKAAFNSVPIETYVIIGNALVFLVWLISTWVVLAYKKKSFALSILHPLTNLAFITLWNKFALIESSVVLQGGAIVAVFKLAIACLILLIAMMALVFIINAPTKRNFGISTIDTITMFFAQWISGNKGLESILAETGELITTQVGLVSFYSKKKLKATFLVPQVHYGPIGNLGGSEFPGLLSIFLKQKTGAPGVIFKGTANHDFDPVYSKDIELIQDTAIQSIRETKKAQFNHASFLEGRKGYSHVFGMQFGETAFLTLSRQPQNCEDIDQALGKALQNKVMAKGFKQAIIIDRHNCKLDSRLFGPGSKEYTDYEGAIDELKSTPGKLKMGIAESRHAFKPEEGIGPGGLKVTIFEIGRKTACFIVVDANNCVPKFRTAIANKIKEHFKFNFVDVLTTDSHAVNSISGIHNPLGQRVDKQIFEHETLATVKKALLNLEPCTAGASVKDIEITVLGQQRSNELVITVNSIFAILKILAPVIFIASIVLAFFALVLI